MFDNATGGDVEANDNIFSAVIPPQEDGTVIEFYIISGDERNKDLAKFRKHR